MATQLESRISKLERHTTPGVAVVIAGLEPSEEDVDASIARQLAELGVAQSEAVVIAIYGLYDQGGALVTRSTV